MRPLALLLAATVALGPGCATMFRSATERVEVTTDPPGAIVAVDGVVQGRSPLVLSFTRSSSSPWIGVWAEGHKERYVKLVRGYDGEGIGYLVMDLLLVPALTGLIGMWIALGVDFSGESFYGFEKLEHHVVLEKAAEGAEPPPWTKRKVGEQPPPPPKGSSPGRPAWRQRL